MGPLLILLNKICSSPTSFLFFLNLLNLFRKSPASWIQLLLRSQKGNLLALRQGRPPPHSILSCLNRLHNLTDLIVYPPPRAAAIRTIPPLQSKIRRSVAPTRLPQPHRQHALHALVSMIKIKYAKFA